MSNNSKIVNASQTNLPWYLRQTKKTDYETVVKIYKSTQWTKMGRWPLPNLTKAMFGDGMSYRENLAIYDIDLPNTTYFDIDGETIYPESDLKLLDVAFGSFVRQRNFAFFEKYFKTQQDLFSQIILLGRELNTVQIETPEFIVAFSKFLEKMYGLTASFKVEQFCGSAIEEELAQLLADSKHKGIILPQLIEPDTVSDTSKFNKSIESAADKLREKTWTPKSNAFLKEANNIATEFGYINTYFLGQEPYSRDDIVTIVLKASEKERPHHTEHVSIGDKKLQKMIWLLNACSQNKLIRFEVSMKALFLIKPVLEKIALKAKLPLADLLELYPDELFTYIQSKYKKLSSHTKFKRAGFVCKDEFLVLSHEDAFKFKREFLENVGDVRELKGNSSYPGNVNAKVRVITALSQFDTFQDGEVLVCSMTDPNYVPLMKKASAIVTDMGGILCHAAIVSRELKKPCVIGTKIATKALKTGEMVEVDAVKGIIKRLNL